MELWAPLRWRFTATDDVAAYGDRWWTWDEQALSRLRGRQLIEIEEAIDLRFVDLINKLHDKKMLGQMAALWVSMHVAGHPVAWDGFDPLVLTTEWEDLPEPPLDSGADPEPDASSLPEPPTESGTS